MAEIRLGPVPQIGAPGVRASMNPRRGGVGAAADAPLAAATDVQPTSAGTAPINIDRVVTIRHAIADGRYPVIPARIGDAMIAAGILLRSPKA